MQLSISTASGGAQHFTATLMDGSVFDAVAIPVDGFGNDVVPTTGIHITFGLQYEGDQGEEANAAKSPCITQSKVTYTSFNPGNPLVGAFEGTIKNNIHQKLDDSVIMTLFNLTPSRCVRWRQMP